MRKVKRAKRTLSIEQKANLIIEKMMTQVRYHNAINGNNCLSFSMREIARLSGYAASNKLMIDLYAMCDHGYLILEQPKIKKTGVTDVKSVFWLPESYAEKLTQKKMFKESA